MEKFLFLLSILHPFHPPGYVYCRSCRLRLGRGGVSVLIWFLWLSRGMTWLELCSAYLWYVSVWGGGGVTHPRESPSSGVDLLASHCYFTHSTSGNGLTGSTCLLTNSWLPWNLRPVPLSCDCPFCTPAPARAVCHFHDNNSNPHSLRVVGFL